MTRVVAGPEVIALVGCDDSATGSAMDVGSPNVMQVAASVPRPADTPSTLPRLPPVVVDPSHCRLHRISRVDRRLTASARTCRRCGPTGTCRCCGVRALHGDTLGRARAEPLQCARRGRPTLDGATMPGNVDRARVDVPKSAGRRARSLREDAASEMARARRGIGPGASSSPAGVRTLVASDALPDASGDGFGPSAVRGSRHGRVDTALVVRRPEPLAATANAAGSRGVHRSRGRGDRLPVGRRRTCERPTLASSARRSCRCEPLAHLRPSHRNRRSAIGRNALVARRSDVAETCQHPRSAAMSSPLVSTTSGGHT